MEELFYTRAHSTPGYEGWWIYMRNTIDDRSIILLRTQFDEDNARSFCDLFNRMANAWAGRPSADTDAFVDAASVTLMAYKFTLADERFAKFMTVTEKKL